MKRVVWTLAVLALALAVGIGFLFGGRLEEAWHLQRLESETSAARLQAARRLGELESESAARRLVCALGERDGDPTGQTARLIFAMGEFAIPFLVSALEDERIFVKLRVLRALALYGESARSAAPAIARLEDEYVVATAVETLEGLGEGGLPGLQRLLESERPNSRFHAARALGDRFPDRREQLLELAASIGGLAPATRRIRVLEFFRSVLIPTEESPERASLEPTAQDQ